LFRFLLAVLSITSLSLAQTLPSLNWAQRLENSGVDTLTGLATDAQGNVYLAGSTLSPYFPVKNAFQNTLGSAGIFEIDASGYSRVGTHTVVSALAADPLNANVFYAISVGSGVKSIDGGNTWTTMTMPSTRLAQFVVDPSNDQNVYADGYDVGFMKSTDGGATWNLIDTGITLPQNLSEIAMWVDPNSHAVFGAVATIMYRSVDAGATWQTVSTAGGFNNLYFDITNPGVLYLLAGGNGWMKSTDDGSTFQPVTLPVTSIFADPNTKGRLLGNGFGGIYESDDDGATWTVKNSQATIFAADWTIRVFYGRAEPTSAPTSGIVLISGDLQTVTPVGPPAITPIYAAVSGGHLYLPASGAANAFVTKLDSSGNVVYSTYIGGMGGSSVTAIVVDAAGNAYVTGGAGSPDFPTTKGAYSTTSGGSFVSKFKPDGSLAYSTFFPETVTALAVDSSGAAYITGATDSSLPVTPGAYLSTCSFCGVVVVNRGVQINTDVFLTKFDPTGSTLIYSTYLGLQNGYAASLALASDGSTYVPSSAAIYHMNATGSSMLGTGSAQLGTQTVVAVGPDGSVYAAGSTVNTKFVATAGAFQTTGPPAALPDQPTTGTGIVKLDAQLQNILAATWFGGSYAITLRAMTIDAPGDVYVAGGTAPRGLPTRTPLFEAFGPAAGTGFLSELSGDLSKLLFSTYLGDTDAFSVAGVASGASGSIVVGGSTKSPSTAKVWINTLTVAPPPALRIDSILNAASVLDGPISSGETIYVRGAGFGSDAQLMIGGAVVPTLAITPGQITAVVPSNLASAVAVQVQSGGATLNIVPVPTAATSPGIFSADGSGSGPGYILNQDGSLNGPTHPAKIGDQITIYATGVGPVTSTSGSAVTSFVPNVMIDGYNCNGTIQQVTGVTCSPVAATFGPVTGFPGSVYKLTMIIPYPAGYHVPPSSIVLNLNGVVSQNGLSIYVNN
jgi:uncharacterized protein (TIGR03437 family)